MVYIQTISIQSVLKLPAIALSFLYQFTPELHQLSIALLRQAPDARDVFVASNLDAASQMHGGALTYRATAANDDRTMDTLIHKAVIGDIPHAHVLFLESIRFRLQASVAEAIKWQAVKVLRVDEEHDQHSALGVSVAFYGLDQAWIGGVGIWVSVGRVEWCCDNVAQILKR